MVAMTPFVVAGGIVPDRLLKFLEPGEGGCWLFTGARLPTGYGRVSFRGKARYAHRVFYELEHGPIPAGLVLDHLCRVRNCVNPSHLRACTDKENLQAPGSQSLSLINKEKTHCPSGHRYDGKNTRIESTGGRKCRRCDLARHQEKYHTAKKLKGFASGERNSHARLSAGQVHEIRLAGSKMRGVDLAAKYGVSKSTISAIRNGRTWRLT